MASAFRHSARLPAAALALALVLLALGNPIADLVSADGALPAGLYDDADADAAPTQTAEPVLPVSVTSSGRPDGGAGVPITSASASAFGPAVPADWNPRAPPPA
jgi:hypothetical protein